MRIVIQRVKNSSVCVDGKTVGSIGHGFMALVGFCEEDTENFLAPMADKMINLRIFTDAEDKMNLSLIDTDGELLVISQFTLYAECAHGNRPSFINAGAPAMANELYEYFVGKCRESGLKVETGEFGADMKVSLLNDGPFTILLDNSILKKS